MGKLLPFFLALAAFADVDTLVRRAQVRLDHENSEGARALLEEALAEDPTNGPALALLARASGWEDVESRLRYLENGVPLDRDVVVDFLGLHVVDLPDDACLRLERCAMAPPDAVDCPSGPGLPWQRISPSQSPLPASGPLRQESLGSFGHRHRDSLRRIADRFEREGFSDPTAWAHLAKDLFRAADAMASRRCLGRSDPVTLDERVAYAEAALRVSPDPYAWWSQNGDELLADLSARGPVPSSYLHGLVSDATDLVVAHRDLVGLARILITDLEVSEVGSQVRGRPFTGTLLAHWLPDIALPALADMKGPGAACLRALLLDDLRQYDQALALLQETVTQTPSYVLGWVLLARLWAEGDRASEALDAAGHVASLALQAHATISWEWIDWHARLLAAAGASDELITLARMDETGRYMLSIAKSGPEGLLAGERIPLLRTVARDPSGEAFELIGACFSRATDADTVAWALDAWSRGPGRGSEPYVPDSFEIPGFREGLLRARVFASKCTLSDREDALCRALFRERSPGEDMPLLFVRVRAELEADGDFLALPGSAYVMSLLFDPHLQSEQAHGWRTRAYDAGCRTRGLLLDLLNDGAPVLPDVAKVDPVEARLEEALRSPGQELLKAFLQEDEARPSQHLRARHALRMRLGDWPWQVESRWSYNEPTPEVAWRALQHNLNRAEMSLLGMGWISSPPYSPRSTATEPSVDDLVSLAERGLWENADWSDAVDRAIAARGPEAFIKLVDGSWGPSAARGVLGRVPSSERGPFVAGLRSLEGRHPLDLRWSWLRAEVALSDSDMAEADDAFARLDQASSQSPFLLREKRSLVRDAQVADTLFDQYMRVRAGDPFGAVLASFQVKPRRPDGELLSPSMVSALAARCLSDEDREGVWRLAKDFYVEQPAAPILAVLSKSADRAIRLRALAEMRLSGTLPDAASSRAIANEDGWTDAQAAVLWGWAAMDAAREGKGDDAIAGLERSWAHGLVGGVRRRKWPEPVLQPGASLAEEASLLPLVDAHVRMAAPPACLWQVVAMIAPRRGDLGRDSGDLLSLAYEHGAATREAWYAWVASLPAGQVVPECRRFLETVREGGEAWTARYVIQSLVASLFERDRIEDGIACLRAWAERCGALVPDASNGPSPFVYEGDRAERTFSPQQAFEGGYFPTRVVLAIELDSIGRPAESHEELERALAEPCTQGVREGCQRALAGIELGVVAPNHPRDTEDPKRVPKWGRPPQAFQEECRRRCVKSLFRILRENHSERIRREAWLRLQRVYEQCPAERGAFVEDLLERSGAAVLPAEEEVRRWGKLLANEDISDRERAETDLRAKGMDALPLLRALRASTDAEVRSRAESILEELAAP